MRRPQDVRPAPVASTSLAVTGGISRGPCRSRRTRAPRRPRVIATMRKRLRPRFYVLGRAHPPRKSRPRRCACSAREARRVRRLPCLSRPRETLPSLRHGADKRVVGKTSRGASRGKLICGPVPSRDDLGAGPTNPAGRCGLDWRALDRSHCVRTPSMQRVFERRGWAAADTFNHLGPTEAGCRTGSRAKNLWTITGGEPHRNCCSGGRRPPRRRRVSGRSIFAPCQAFARQKLRDLQPTNSGQTALVGMP